MKKKEYQSEIGSSDRRGRPLGSLEDAIKEYMKEIGTGRWGEFERARIECL